MRRLSHSEYNETLILKGGLFIFALTNFESRPTMDIDFLMINRSNENDKMLSLVEKIINSETKNNYINFVIKGVSPIREHRQYHGARIKMLGIIGNTNTPFNILKFIVIYPIHKFGKVRKSN